jgi:hypothetical protein
MDVAGLGGFHPTEAGKGVRCGLEATVGAPLRHGSPDTGTGPPRCFGAFGAPGDASEGAETLRQIARKAQRPALWPSRTLPGPKEGSLSARRRQAKGFAMDIKLIAKPLGVKTQAKEQPNSTKASWMSSRRS